MTSKGGGGGQDDGGCQARIGDFVWHDLDCDGIQDAGEPGLPGVRVRLLQGGNEVAETETGDEGEYAFDQRCGGTYTVEVDTPAGLVPTEEGQGGDDELDSERSPAEVTLAGGSAADSDVSIDFGFHGGCCAGELVLGDRVWNDLDCDGIQDDGEPGLPGVVVRLEQGGLPFGATTTGDDGRYRFEQLCPGTYLVTVDPGSLPGGFAPSPCDAGGDDGQDSDCSPATVELMASDLSLDFGYHSPCCDGAASIGDRVWDDVDCDGVQDAGEPGLPGVHLWLHDTEGTLFGEAETNGEGHYAFGHLCAGTYVVTVDEASLPQGFTPSPCDMGDDALDNDCSPVEVVLTANDQVEDSVDFGYRPLCCGGQGKIGDRVWNDLDCDGVREPGEPGLAFVRLRLLSDQGQPLLETFTERNGRYVFAGLCAGTYVVEVDASTLPPGFEPTPCDATDDEIDSDCSGEVLLPLDDAVDLTIDFGFHAPCCSGTGSIGDRIWNDRNCDGFQDPDEVGLPGVELVLSKDGVPFGVTASDERGEYVFDGLCAGTYTVEVDPQSVPPGFVASPCDAWADDADSDCGPVTVVLPHDGSREDTVDFGFHGCCEGTSKLGERTWLDRDGDGIFDEDERGLAGIVVRVLDEHGTLVDDQVTAERGAWRVSGLCAGTYTVEAFAPPALGLVPTLCDAGDDDEVDSECSPVTVVLPADTVDFSIDFGFVEE